jgi:EAL domain-containing protein (putative c-di-GMP-specific phosphodiesterase class I)
MYFHYQPIYKNNKIIYLEALLRLDESSINIEDYVNSQSDKVSFDLMILEKVLDDIKTSIFHCFSINISLLSLESNVFTRKCIELINKSKKNIILEITEHDKSSKFDIIKENIIHIKKYSSCKFAIDDFGKGYSNTDLLIGLPIDIVKIDRGITKGISKSFLGFILLKNMIYKLSSILKKDIVVEGIENEIEVKILENISSNIKCQGYFFARPNVLNTFSVDINDSDKFTEFFNIKMNESVVLKLEELIYQLTVNDHYEINHSDFENIFLYEFKPQDIKKKANELLKRVTSSKMLFMSSLMMSSNCAMIIRDIFGCVVYNNDLHIEMMNKDFVGIEPYKLVELYDFYQGCLDFDKKLICSKENFSYEQEFIDESKEEYHIFRQKIISNNNMYVLSSIYRVAN